MLDMIKNYSNVAITPDGPTGPPRKMKAGAVVLSKKTGAALVMLGVGYSNKISLKSWDKFQIPLPFSRVVAVYSEPYEFDMNMTYEQTSEKITECESKLNSLQREAEILCLTR
jgi:hypothetical protein